MNLIFVYGTLRKGYHNHHVLRGATFIDTAHTGPGYTKITQGLPYLVLDPEGRGCDGELYEVSDLMLKMLDRFEGSPDWYTRTKITLDNGAKAWCYLMPKERISS